MAEFTGRVVLGIAGLAFSDLDFDTIVARLEQSIDDGGTFFDTAHGYGRPGDTRFGERMIGQARRGRDVLVGTKGGHTRVEADRWDAEISAPRLRADVEGSLIALEQDTLDLFYIHRVDLAAEPVEEGIAAVAKLRDEGKIARIGVSNITVDELERASAITRIDAVQNRHGALDHDSADVVAWCEANDVSFYAYSPLGGAFSTPAIDAEAARRGVSRQRLLLRGLLSSSPIMNVVTGATRLESMRDSRAAETEPWDEALAAAYAADIAAHRG